MNVFRSCVHAFMQIALETLGRGVPWYPPECIIFYLAMMVHDAFDRVVFGLRPKLFPRYPLKCEWSHGGCLYDV